MDEADLVRLRHMLDAAREAIAFASGETRASLGKDRKLAPTIGMRQGTLGFNPVGNGACLPL